MEKKFLTINFSLLFLTVFSLLFGFNFVQASSLIHVSDTISTSQTLAGADHIINFTVTTPVPSYGKIVITPQGGEFYIPPTMNHTDIRFLVNSYQWQLGPLPDVNINGVEIIAGMNGKVTITLAPNLSLSQGDSVIVQIGIGISNRQIMNPSTTGSYRINIQTFDYSDNLLDRATAMIAIVEQVQVGVEPTQEEPLFETLPGYYIEDPLSIVLYGGLYNLGWSPWADVYFQYREQGTETWNETIKYRKTDPTIFNAVITGVKDNTVYEFRAVIDWWKWYNEVEPYATTSYGEILEIPLPPLAEPQPPGGGGGGGGAGGGGGGGVPANPPPPPLFTPPPYIVFSGWAFRSGKINLLKEGEFYKSTIANLNAGFKFEINEPHIGTFNFVLEAQDNQGRNTPSLSFTVESTKDMAAVISNILFAPTIEINKRTVKKGESLEIYGASVLDGVIQIQIIDSKNKETLKTTKADSTGNWRFTLDTKDMKEDIYKVRTRVVAFNEVSSFSQTLTFNIGITCIPADLNCDRVVDVVDFSILMFYWNTTNPRADINGDGIVNIVDFSIMMAFWGPY